EQGTGAGPEMRDMGAGVRRALVEAQPCDVAGAGRLEFEPEFHRVWIVDGCDAWRRIGAEQAYDARRWWIDSQRGDCARRPAPAVRDGIRERRRSRIAGVGREGDGVGLGVEACGAIGAVAYARDRQVIAVRIAVVGEQR